MTLETLPATIEPVVLQFAVLGWPIELLVAMAIVAFAGGVFGTAIGSLPAFVFTGIVLIAGESARLVGSSGGDPGIYGGVGITSEIAFGGFFGPHIGFAAALAGSAYAAKRGYMEPGFGGNWGYHDAKNILIGFGTRHNDVLLVGGLFGVVGFALFVVSDALALPWDPIAMAVVGSAALHRLVLGYDLVGAVRSAGILDASPFAREDTHTTDGQGGKPDERLDVEVWQPWFYEWPGVALIGVTAGVLGGFTFWATGSPFLGFGISAVSLIFVQLSVENDFESVQVEVPGTHHITLPASTAPMAYAGIGLTEATPTVVQSELMLAEVIALGAAFGLLGALLGELFDRVFYMHGDTHWDPPATSIVVTTFLIAALSMIGVFPTAGWIPTPI